MAVVPDLHHRILQSREGVGLLGAPPCKAPPMHKIATEPCSQELWSMASPHMAGVAQTLHIP